MKEFNPLRVKPISRLHYADIQPSDRLFKIYIKDIDSMTKENVGSHREAYMCYSAKSFEDIPEHNLKAFEYFNLIIPIKTYEIARDNCKNKNWIDLKPDKKYSMIMHFKRETRKKMVLEYLEWKEKSKSIENKDMFIEP